MKKIILIVSGGLGLGMIGYSVRKGMIDKKKDARSYDFQKKLEVQLSPKDNIADPLFDNEDPILSKVKLNNDEIKSIAKNIWKSFGGWLNDNEEKIYSQLRLISNYSEYKLVAKQYMINSDGVSLDFDLKDRLSDSEFKNVQQIFNTYENE